MALGAMGVTACLPFASARAQAQTQVAPDPDPLATARALFGDALLAEQAGRFAEALEKFERVRAVRDTASIEYRIGSCHEGLGEPALAFRAYLAAQALGGSDPNAADVSRAASDRLEALARRVARLTLAMPSPAPADAEVQIDGSVVSPMASLPLAPGRHVVSATASGTIPFQSEIALAEGAEVTLTVVLAPRPARPVERPAPEVDSVATAPWFAVGGGGVLVAVSAILLVARHDAIADLNRACPGGTCPPGADANDLESTRSRALVEGPVAVGCGAAGIALAAIGVYWVTRTHPAGTRGSTLSLAPLLTRGGGGVALSGALR